MSEEDMEPPIGDRAAQFQAMLDEDTRRQLSPEGMLKREIAVSKKEHDLAQRQRALEDERRKLLDEIAERERALEEEKREMTKHTVQSSDIIELSVGGRPFQTTRATLCAQPDTLLANMFSGRWEGSLPRDKEGRIFLDFDPDLFAMLLNHLRDKSHLPKGAWLQFPPVDASKQESCQVMLDYLGFGADTGAVRFVSSEHFKASADGRSVDLQPSNALWEFWSRIIRYEQGEVENYTDKFVFTTSAGECVPGVAWRGVMITRAEAGMVGIVPADLLHGYTCKQGYAFHQWDGDLVPYSNGVMADHPPAKRVIREQRPFTLSLSATGELTLSDDVTGESETITDVDMTKKYRWAFWSSSNELAHLYVL